MHFSEAWKRLYTRKLGKKSQALISEAQTSSFYCDLSARPFGQHLKMKPTFIIIICTSRQLVLASFYFKGRIEKQQQENIKGRQRKKKTFFYVMMFSPLVRWCIKRS